MSLEPAHTRVPLLNRLVKAFCRLPGIGEKSAQRIAFALLARRRQEGLELAEVLREAMVGLKHCVACRNFCEADRCSVCNDLSRDETQICVVEMPSDLYALEQLQQYQGHYFVLFGRLSPIDGILPQTLGLEQLQKRLGQMPRVSELIIATNPTVEGEITAQYIAEVARTHGVHCNRIAHGVPMGAELEYMDRLTLSYALSGRRPIAALTEPCVI